VAILNVQAACRRAFAAIRCLAAPGQAAHAGGAGKYQAGAVSGISFAVACLAFLAGGPWSQFRHSGGLYTAGAVPGSLAAFTAATVMHGRRGGHGGATRALASMAFGWATAIAGVILAWIALWVPVAVLLSRSCLPGG
jgi:hypothetical protein